MKQVIVSFNFDPETEMVSDVKCTVDGIEKKKKTTRKVKEVVKELESEIKITLEPNKLVFNNLAASEMQLQYEDRVVIKWEQVNNQMIPVIGKDLSFGEEGSGNKVTKSNTVTYKGKANTILAEIGTEFTLTPYKDGIWRLVSLNSQAGTVSHPENTIEQVIEEAEKIEPELLVSTDDTTEIDELKFNL